MLDSGASANYIALGAVQRLGLGTEPKETPHYTNLADGTKRWVTMQTHVNKMRIAGHKEDIQFDIVLLRNEGILLGKPWLRKHNLEVDWQREIITFTRYKCLRGKVPQNTQITQGGSNGRAELCAISCKEFDRIEKDNPGSI